MFKCVFSRLQRAELLDKSCNYTAFCRLCHRVIVKRYVDRSYPIFDNSVVFLTLFLRVVARDSGEGVDYEYESAIHGQIRIAGTSGTGWYGRGLESFRSAITAPCGYQNPASCFAERCSLHLTF